MMAALHDGVFTFLVWQDGVGAGHASVSQASDYFAAIAQAVAAASPPRQLWSDVELFSLEGQQSAPAPIGRVVRRQRTHYAVCGAMAMLCGGSAGGSRSSAFLLWQVLIALFALAVPFVLPLPRMRFVEGRLNPSTSVP